MSWKRELRKIQLNEAGDITIEAELSDGKRKKFLPMLLFWHCHLALWRITLNFSPSLPPNLITDIVKKPTWMAGQAKVVAVYDRPFWRELGLSGYVLSAVGPLEEIYDASPNKGPGALFGFFGMPPAAREKNWVKIKF
ncbi:hypothetical protein GCM10020331_094480 [Ectobacillus funiculus]